MFKPKQFKSVTKYRFVSRWWDYYTNACSSWFRNYFEFP